ncbi:MAG: DUF4982 domain-containing protein, partial [Verrucomicrobiae bacterium]|nr:DUF4982 domain-containing protein [Verrucomicrobiae bacterium]NNJ87502.1 DUF4982 domain-containing protein [Akkermansiaceae bacterium]
PYPTGDEAEIFLNAKSLGVRKIKEKSPYNLEWMVPYSPGELKAVARKKGTKIATTTIRTAGPPAQFKMEADQIKLDPRKRDLTYITLRIEDKDGNFDPKGERWITINIKGPARILGVHNGDPLSHNPFQSNTVRTFNGLARVIVASTTGKDVIKPKEEREQNEIIITAYARGWQDRQLRLKRTHEGTSDSVFTPDNAGPRATDVYDDDVPPVD